MQTCPEGEKNILFKVDSNISSMPVINSMTTTKIIKKILIEGGKGIRKKN